MNCTLFNLPTTVYLTFVHDPEGNIVNAYNKKQVKTSYDGFVINFKIIWTKICSSKNIELLYMAHSYNRCSIVIQHKIFMIMKKFFLSVFMLAFLVISRAQSQQELNQRINTLFQKLEQNYSGTDSSFDKNLNAIDAWNDSIKWNMAAYVQQAPRFLQDKCEWGNHCLTSKDKKFRTVTWADGNRGTLKLSHSMIFWQAGNKVKSYSFDEDSIYGNHEIKELYTIKRRNGQTLYFIIGWIWDGIQYEGQFVKAFAIDKNGNLDQNVLAFKTSKEQLNAINVDIEHPTIGDKRQITFVDDNTLKIPIVPRKDSDESNDENRKPRYLTYKFDGTNFIFHKKK